MKFDPRDTKKISVVSGAVAGALLSACLLALPVLAVGSDDIPSGAISIQPPNYTGAVPAGCDELASAIAEAIKTKTVQQTIGIGSYDPSKTFQLNNDCLKTIKMIKIDLSIAIFDMTGWADMLANLADQLIRQVQQAACDLASSSINDVLGRYNNVIGLMNTLDPSNIWSSALTYAVDSAKKEGTAAVADQASQWHSQVKDVTSPIPIVTLPPLPIPLTPKTAGTQSTSTLPSTSNGSNGMSAPQGVTNAPVSQPTQQSTVPSAKW
ncbi:hypothetical protein R6242_21380 [Iodobacter sp. CM08]|uniref:hypothetical protein n=1 Tax=Iodobacter sp. CM08 TaxID=3085902 RepID=UPI0029824137|nr:hypothetical protein [Iodobacter sp. CM08]MDW5419129.1 hypothetical protein [Iodobacter sp. CM08]